MMDTSLLKNYSLHWFADANKYVYAVCIFIRAEMKDLDLARLLELKIE